MTPRSDTSYQNHARGDPPAKHSNPQKAQPTASKAVPHRAAHQETKLAPPTQRQQDEDSKAKRPTPGMHEAPPAIR